MVGYGRPNAVDIRVERPWNHNRQALPAARIGYKIDYCSSTTGLKPEKVKILLENLGQRQKTPKKKEQQNSDMSVVEIAEPDNRHSVVNRLPFCPVEMNISICERMQYGNPLESKDS